MPAGAVIIGLAVLAGTFLAQKRRRETALRESERFFRELQRTARIGSYRCDLLAGTWQASEMLDEILGIDATAVRNFAGWLDLIHPDDRATITRYLQDEVLGGRRDFDREYRIVPRGDGTVRWVHGRGTVARDPAGRAIAMTGTIQDITERRASENALREGARRLHDITSSMGDWMWETDAQGVYTYSSAHGVALFGEVVGKTPCDFMPPAEAERVGKIFGELAARRAPIRDLENWNDTARGQQVCLLTNGVPILDADGQLTGYRGVNKNITDRKHLEAALREGLERMRAITHSAHDAIISADGEGLITSWNIGAEYIFGYSESDAIGQPVTMLMPERYQARHTAELSARSTGGRQRLTGTTVELEGLRRDGAIFPIDLSLSRWEASGRPFFTSIIRDTTERKRIDAAMRESEERFRAIFEESPLGVAVIDSLTGGIYDVNPRFAAIVGRTREEVATLDWMSITHPDDVSKDLAFKARMNAGEIPGYTMNKRYRRPDGSYVWTSLTVAPMHVALAHRPRHLAMIEDITERKLLEEQFLQSQKMESVGRLAGGVAHDFNNMLSVILGRTELVLLKTDATQPIRAHLLEIEEAARRSANLTRQLLAFARRQTITPEVLDLNDTVAGSLRMLQRLIGEDINLLWHPGATLWPVRIDPSQMDQILANLCINVRDAISDVGTLRITTANRRIDAAFAATYAGAEPGEYVLLTVSDTGCGMDAATMAQIFDPFFTTKEVGKGTGLGLSTVYGAVKQNGGFVAVESTVNEGTTFEIYLPRYAGQAGHKAAPGTRAPMPRGDETILLVEDEPVVLDLTTEMLEAQGYTVLAAGGPAVALRLVEEHAGPIDLLLTDVMMPQMNGRELANRIAVLHPDLRCLFMSGYTSDIIGARGVLDEETHFLQKPFSLASLSAAVRLALNARRCLVSV